MEIIRGQLPKGILHSKIGEQTYALTRFQPSPKLSPFVQHYWVVQWDVRETAPYLQQVLSHPNVNLIVERDIARIYGVSRTTSTRLIEDHGWVVGVKFKPGGFYPFWHKPISELTDHSISFEDVFGEDDSSLRAAIFAMESLESAVQLVESRLAAVIERLPGIDSDMLLVSELVANIQADRSMMKVDDVVQRTGMHIRKLQRLFDRYVGVSPKWVIQRYRLHEAAASMEQGEATDWSKFSLDLGYYDQSHFIRDFKAIIGRSPEDYVRKV
ncbi:helix-turn-helix domain-containing protein [Paenibacillus arenosi]|uniref:AraC family transcriptional regulator n=1 Tax=Paenibacillus arenosi TaxID=2774142 RepID=A0ABR9AYN7_9BACL|nr:helix-turn-helix domain-containing protein [Paenibacillus arenosi]MBD8499203.1 AraC family transcriptional regulator [Paenibacillus arenosi]